MNGFFSIGVSDVLPASSRSQHLTGKWNSRRYEMSQFLTIYYLVIILCVMTQLIIPGHSFVHTRALGT